MQVDQNEPLYIAAGIGLLVGLGKLLDSEETLTVRLVVGRAIASAALGLMAGAVLLFVPSMPLVAYCGIAAVASSLGTSLVEKVVLKYLRSR